MGRAPWATPGEVDDLKAAVDALWAALAAIGATPVDTSALKSEVTSLQEAEAGLDNLKSDSAAESPRSVFGPGRKEK
jgi:hypothetical protein